MTEKSLVGTVYITHSNTEINTGEKTALDVKMKGGYPFIKKIILFIPESLDLKRIIEQNPPTFKFKLDHFHYILDLIYSIPAKSKKKQDEYYGYTPINKTILGATIKNYRKYIDYLKERGIIIEDNYIPNQKSQGLRFTQKYQTPTVPVEINDWTLIKNVIYLRKKVDRVATQKLEFLKKWFKGLEIDLKSGEKWLKKEYSKDSEIKNALMILNARLYPIRKLYYEPDKLFHVDSTAGRLHTYLTQLKSELRKFVSFKGKTLCSIDIVNSQPYLLLSLLFNEQLILNKMTHRLKMLDSELKPEDEHILTMLGDLIQKVSKEKDVIVFKEIVTKGRFYEEFGEILINNGTIKEKKTPGELRKIVKKITFTTLFSKNSNIKKDKRIRIFKETFPNVYKIIEFIKKRRHQTLAIILQNLEADLVLHKACKIISMEKPKVPIFTLHDSIITTEENVEYVKTVLNNVLEKYIGVAPVLKIERWE